MKTPFIDPSVRYVGVSYLRSLNRDSLRSLDKTLVVSDDEKQLVVILSYECWLHVQSKLIADSLPAPEASAQNSKSLTPDSQ